MYPRVNYEMTEADLEKILDACKATPVMYLAGGVPMGPTPQENANLAWSELGLRMGFDSMTVEPIPGMDSRHFTAVPRETEIQRSERVAKEAESQRKQEILLLQEGIRVRQDRLAELTK